MKKKFIIGMAVGLLPGLVATGFAIDRNIKYNDLKNSEVIQEHGGLVSTIESLRSQLKTTQNECDKLTLSIDKLVAENDANNALIVELQNEVDSLIIIKEDLEAQGTADAETIADLNNQIAGKKEEIVILEDDIEELLGVISTLENEKSTLTTNLSNIEKQLADLSNENDDNLVQIALLQQQLQASQNEVTRLSGLIADYEELANQAFEVSFYIGNVNLHTDAIKSGQTVTVLPDTTGYVISGWTLADGTVVDPLTYEITSNTIFYGVEREIANGYVLSVGAQNSIYVINVEEDSSYLSYYTSPSHPMFQYNDYASWTDEGFTWFSAEDFDNYSEEKVHIRVLGYVEGVHDSSKSQTDTWSLVPNAYYSQDMVNNPDRYGELSNYKDFETQLVELNKEFYDDHYYHYTTILNLGNLTVELTFNPIGKPNGSSESIVITSNSKIESKLVGLVLEFYKY